ncbi:hypothetical protein [Bacillus toyonensis]|uniref:hypothetical protein n=1 Tax=Bacillus toyonensis TaxID=155322 RepID=UPI000BEDDA47|nr:hypothetical protein [Bacillus toyonensis]MCU4967867.1 hypothetical protein [Bacillus toyonensis]PEA32439.1 hypothetical protein COO13_14780 [Bacillus toyonensis]PEJ83363.1 hypothetical protein CN891_27640 [Bacillus toyonensis]PEK07538.1 hypothetical protein CN683_30515 [Bacillus toyonensis]PEL34675.1 hypothetical protein CN605_29325 [Bacillus toyonensis]
MRGRKKTISFREFMDRSYEDKEKKIRKYNSISPFAFLHMSDQVLNTYIALGVMGTVLIGAVMLEKYLVRHDYISVAKFVSEGIYHGMRIGGICLIGYVFIHIVIMF